MITANDLMTGNLLQGKPIRIMMNVDSDGVTAITAHGIDLIERGLLNNLTPIPISSEWLIKFGFEKSGYDYWNSRQECFELRDRENGEYCYCVNCGEYDVSEPIQYIHQLQNLYKALTNKELKQLK